ncbi:MAG: prolipoprotein diacylglyceryl transferase [Beijerinckiaceae bacterium]|nr:prolipoprotein diacylglyceryl transferase [Beijerinckiaceae bacterium]
MPLFAIPFPAVDPVLFAVGPFAVRWYALAYIAGLLLGWLYARALVRRPALWGGRPIPTETDLDDMLVYCALGVILGGRLFYVLFYNLDFFLANPAEIPAIWRGGMSFHGGLVGCATALIVLAKKKNLPILSFADLASAVVPLGLFFGRIANFINGELWGRVTDVWWAMVFPHAGPFPRHPSQLYEAVLEGLAILIILGIVIARGGLKKPGYVSGLFGVLYALGRIASEFFREPDPQLGFLFGGATMGMLLSLPLLAAGLYLMARARRS